MGRTSAALVGVRYAPMARGSGRDVERGIIFRPWATLFRPLTPQKNLFCHLTSFAPDRKTPQLHVATPPVKASLTDDDDRPPAWQPSNVPSPKASLLLTRLLIRRLTTIEQTPINMVCTC